MNLIIKVVSAIIVIITLYFVGVFLAPDLTDRIAGTLGFGNLNKKIRELKSGSENLGDDVWQVKKAKEAIDQTSDAIQKTQDVVTEKIEQTNKVIDSTQKVIDSTKTLKNDIDALTTLSGGKSSK